MTLDRSQALTRAGSAPVARLATSRSAGAPHIVPVTFAIQGDKLMTMVDRKPKTTTALQRLANIDREPRVSILVDHYEDDWAMLWWVRIDGIATVSTSGDAWATALEALTAKYHQYRETPPDGPAISVEIRDVTWWEAAP